MHNRTKLLQEALPRLLRRQQYDRVKRVLESSHAADLATVLQRLTRSQRRETFRLIEDQSLCAELLCELDVGIASDFLGELDDETLLVLLLEMGDDDAADMLELLSEERAQEVLKKLKQAGEQEVIQLFEYPPDSAGGLMTTDFFALVQNTTCAEALKELQEHGDEFEVSYYIYVINSHHHLVGVVSLRQLVLSSHEKPLKEVMESDVVRVGIDTDQEDVASVVARYNLLAIPVVDPSNILVGVVTVDDIIDVISSEATEDILKMAGAGEELLIEDSSAFQAARSRIPWLLASFVGGVAAAILIGAFEETIAKVVPLAAFIPIVLGMGGNVGIQSATIVTRGIAMGRIDTSKMRRVIIKELLVSTICGVTYGLLLGTVALVRYHNTDAVTSSLMLGCTVGLAVAAAMIISAFVGGSIPMIFDRINVDPALASGPFVTTTVDVLGIIIYFGIAVVLLGL